MNLETGIRDPKTDLVALKQEVAKIIKSFGHERRDEPFELSSAGWSYDYVDGKRAISKGERLMTVATAIGALAQSEGAEFEAVGGLTMGADPIAVAVAILLDIDWFSVRKEPKRHGKQKRVEGKELGQGSRVLLVDDVVSTGGSILTALDVLNEMGVLVVLATTLVDRGELAVRALRSRNVPYRPLLTYRDLEIEPIG